MPYLPVRGRKVRHFMGGSIGPRIGNMRKFVPTNSHGNAFAPKQSLYEKEVTGMESSKMY